MLKLWCNINVNAAAANRNFTTADMMLGMVGSSTEMEAPLEEDETKMIKEEEIDVEGGEDTDATVEIDSQVVVRVDMLS